MKLLLLIALATVGLSRPLVPGLISLASAVAVPTSLELFGDFTGSFTWAVGMTAAWSAAYGAQQLYDVVRQLTEAQSDLAEAAASGERRRIAAELHDLIAHTMAVTMLHVTGARLALQTDDRSEAIEALEEAERSGRASLADIRRTVGLLADGAPTTTALPDASSIPGLVAGFSTAGLPVALSVAGDLGSLDPTIGLALFRLTQESLANVVRHGGRDGAELNIAIESARISFEARNRVEAPPARSTDGRGIAGMRDRVAALGGTLVASCRDGRWIVHAEIPR